MEVGITVATHPNNHAALHSRCPEAMVIDINDTKMLTKMIEATDSILSVQVLSRFQR